MHNFQTEEELSALLQTSNIIRGNFSCDYIPQSLSDEFYQDKVFEDCVILKGSFISCSFRRCKFKNVIFRETDFAGTDFINCEFENCIFSNVDSGFTMQNCKVTDLSQFFEEESMMGYHIAKLKEGLSDS